MGFTNGKWVAQTAPNQLDYPFEIAAKLIRDKRTCTHEEICQLIADTKKFYELCKEQDTIIRQIKKDLKIAEATIRLLQTTDL